MTCRNWLTTQMQASFKGVPFEANEDGREGGRRNQTHEYASSETWDNEDLGRRKLLIHVSGLVDGNDADDRSEALLAACNSPGPGLLILPNRPPLMAICDQIASSWQKNAQGFYAVQMSFTAESGVPLKPFSYTQFAGLIDIATQAALTAAADAFSIGFDSIMRRFSPARFVPAVARDAAAVTIAMAATALEDLRRQCRMEPAKAAEVAFACQRMAANAATLAFTGERPDAIAAESFVADQANVDNGFAGTFIAAARMLGGAADPQDLIQAVPGLAAFTAQSLPNRAQVFSVRAETALTWEVARLVRRVALILWMIAIGRSKFAARDDAIAVRADLVTAFADEDDAGLRGALDAAVSYLASVAARLPSSQSITFYAPLPAAVIATRLYADPTRDAELIARNGDCDPLYSPLDIVAAAA